MLVAQQRNWKVELTFDLCVLEALLTSALVAEGQPGSQAQPRKKGFQRFQVVGVLGAPAALQHVQTWSVPHEFPPFLRSQKPSGVPPGRWRVSLLAEPC